MIENVRGFLDAVFQDYREGLKRQLEALGYKTEWRLLNASDFGRSLGISYHTVQKSLVMLEGHFLVRRLPPYHANVGKRLVKAPKLYLRNTGLLHHLLGI